MNARKVVPWLAAGSIAIAIAATVFAWLPRTNDDRPRSVAAEHALPAAVPYEFVWPDGAARGIDVPKEIYIPSTGRRLPMTAVGDLRSLPGEELVPFLQRVRHEMVAYSDRQTFEACALICSGGDSEYSVRMTSVGAVAHCAVAPICMDDHTSMKQTIHSHCPDRRNLRATVADEFLSGGTMRRQRYFGTCDPNAFSSTDFAGWRPGWLAGVDALYRQDGPNDITAYESATAAPDSGNMLFR